MVFFFILPHGEDNLKGHRKLFASLKHFPTGQILWTRYSIQMRLYLPRGWEINTLSIKAICFLLILSYHAVDQFIYGLQIWVPLRPFRINTQKRCPFHYRGLECKSRKSRNTWSNSQIWPWHMEWSRAKTNRVLPRKCTGHSKHPLPTTQKKTLHMDITRWSTPKSDWLYSLQPKMETLYTVSKNKTRSWLWLRPWTPYCQIQT